MWLLRGFGELGGVHSPQSFRWRSVIVFRGVGRGVGSGGDKNSPSGDGGNPHFFDIF
jgi:hypothetical protein